jgi:hypothetical protein
MALSRHSLSLNLGGFVSIEAWRETRLWGPVYIAKSPSVIGISGLRPNPGLAFMSLQLTSKARPFSLF